MKHCFKCIMVIAILFLYYLVFTKRDCKCGRENYIGKHNCPCGKDCKCSKDGPNCGCGGVMNITDLPWEEKIL